jgi:hypothetical protein
MERVRGQKQGTPNGFKVVRLVIRAIIFEQAELSVQASPAPRTYPES